MRRIVTETVDGRSRVQSVENVGESGFATLWTTTPDAPLGHADSAGMASFPNEAGAAKWIVATVPPIAEMQAALRNGVPGIDPDGFHLTNTVDFVIILDGELSLALGQEIIVVGAGDLVVQRHTNHAWLNHGDKPVRLLAVMLGLPS